MKRSGLIRTFATSCSCILLSYLVTALSAFSEESGSDFVDPPADPTAEPGIEPHWSRLPIWGTAAAEKGFQLPLPFGVGVNYYRETQPFNIRDLQISLGGDPISVKDFAKIDEVNTTQTEE